MATREIGRAIHQDGGNVTELEITVTEAVASGAVVLGVQAGGGTTTTVFTADDDAGTSYSVAVLNEDDVLNNRLAVLTGQATGLAVGDKIRVQSDQPRTLMIVIAVASDEATVLDATADTSGVGKNVSTGSAASGQAVELVLMVAAWTSGAGQTLTPDGTWEGQVTAQATISAKRSLGVVWRTETAAGQRSASGVLTSGASWAAAVVALAAVAAPAITMPEDLEVPASEPVTVSASAVARNGGSIASYLWEYEYPASGGPALSGATTDTVTFTAQSPGSLYRLRLTVADNDGTTASDTVEVAVPTTGDLYLLEGTVTYGSSWALVGGAGSAAEALGDDSDATYMQVSDVGAAEEVLEGRLSPTVPRSAANVVLRGRPSGSPVLKARLYQDATLLQEWDFTGMTATLQNVALALDPETLLAIQEWTHLRLAVGVSA